MSGVAKSQLRLAQLLLARGLNVKLIICFDEDNFFAHEGEPEIDFACLEQPRISRSFFQIRQEIVKYSPHLIITAEDHLNFLVLLAAKTVSRSIRVACSSRVTPYDVYSMQLCSKKGLFKAAAAKVFQLADILSTVSVGNSVEYKKFFPSLDFECLYNPVDVQNLRLRAQGFLEKDVHLQTGSSKTLVAAGMLEPWKGYDFLLRAFARIIKSVDARLIILGNGSEMQNLQKLAAELKISDLVIFKGRVPDPLPYFALADLFVHTAKVESFGNVLIESLACGLPVVAIDCPAGPREIIGGVKYCRLVGTRDVDMFAAACLDAIHERPLTIDFSEELKKFDMNITLQRYIELL